MTSCCRHRRRRRFGLRFWPASLLIVGAAVAIAAQGTQATQASEWDLASGMQPRTNLTPARDNDTAQTEVIRIAGETRTRGLEDRGEQRAHNGLEPTGPRAELFTPIESPDHNQDRKQQQVKKSCRQANIVVESKQQQRAAAAATSEEERAPSSSSFLSGPIDYIDADHARPPQAAHHHHHPASGPLWTLRSQEFQAASANFIPGHGLDPVKRRRRLRNANHHQHKHHAGGEGAERKHAHEDEPSETRTSWDKQAAGPGSEQQTASVARNDLSVGQLMSSLALATPLTASMDQGEGQTSNGRWWCFIESLSAARPGFARRAGGEDQVDCDKLRPARDFRATTDNNDDDDDDDDDGSHHWLKYCSLEWDHNHRQQQHNDQEQQQQREDTTTLAAEPVVVCCCHPATNLQVHAHDTHPSAALPTTRSGDNFSIQDMIVKGQGLVLVLSVIILITFAGNVLVCLSVIKVRKLRHPSNYLLISLAISDLCVACFVMPFGLYQSINDKWQLGTLLCNVYVVSDVASCTASILNLCVISIDRYLAITRPLTYCMKRTTRLMMILIGVVWCLACLISVPPLLITGNEYGTDTEPRCEVSQSLWYQLYATCISFYIPLIVMICLYYNIYTAAKKVIEAEQRATTGLNANSTSSVMKERKASITLGVIMSAFTICWLPFFIIALLRPFSDTVNNLPRWFVLLTLWLGYANSLLNPIIYVTFHHDFRHAFKHLLCLRCMTINEHIREDEYKSQYGETHYQENKRKLCGQQLLAEKLNHL